MHRLAKRTALAAIAAVFIVHSSAGYGAIRTWTGATNNIALNTNWGGTTPTPADTGQFLGAGQFNPTLGVLAAPNLFGAATLNFNSPSSYTIISDGRETFDTYAIELFTGGMVNLNATPHSFKAIRGGLFAFLNSSSGGNNTFTYNVDSDTVGFNSAVVFANNSTAGTATYKVGAVSTQPAAVQFGDFSTASSANFQAFNAGLIEFLNSSTAANSQISATTHASVIFIDSSSAGNTVISLNLGTVQFDTITATSTAQATLINGSSCEVYNSIALNKLTTDVSSSISIFNYSILTVGDASTGNAINGPITGAGGFAKQGSGDLAVTNPNNNYTDGTFIHAGKLIGTTQSLPSALVQPSITIDANAILNYNNSASGAFSGDILDNGTILYTGTSSAELDGIISGSGNLVVNAPGGTFKITNPSNSYNGGTHVIAGTLIATAQSLPLAAVQPSATIDPNAVLNFNDTVPATFAGDIVDNGTFLSTHSTQTTLSGIISGSGTVIENGPNGILSLTNTSNSYTGGTQIINGKVVVLPASLPIGVQPFAVTAFNNGVLTFGLGSGTFSGAVQLNDSSVVQVSNNNTITLSNVLTGTGSVLVDIGSTLIFSGTPKTYTGGSNVNGTLQSEGQLLPANGPVTLGNSTAKLIFTTTGSNSFNGAISGAGQVLMNGPGIQTLTGVNSYSGGTTVNSGTLIGNTGSLPAGIMSPAATVNGTATLEFDQGSIGTFNGGIFLNGPFTTLLTTGSGILTVAGPITGTGELILSTAHVILTSNGNTYSGGTNVSLGSILEGNSGSLQGAIVDNGEVIFNQTSNGSTSASFSSTNTTALISKKGAGILTLTNSSAGFQGKTNVEQGSLLVNNILGGSVTVFANALLGGNGTILGNVLNNGFISPGNSIGTLTIGGNYQQTFSGTYIDEIDAFGNSDLINIAGTASLGGSLIVVTIDGVIDSTKTYTILHAAGGVSGVFAHVSSTNPMLVPTVHYLPNDVTLNVESIFVQIATNHNQREVADQLLSITHPTAQELAILTELARLAESPATVDQALKALSQMSGEQYTNAQWLSETSNRQFLRRLYDPLRSVITADIACQDGCPEYICDRGQYYTCSQWEASNKNCVSAWLEMGGGHAFVEHDKNAAGFNLNSVEIAGGGQMTVDQCWTLGVAGEYEHDRLHYNVGGSGLNTSGLAGLYGLYRPKWGYVLADFVLDYSHSKVKRPIVIGDISLTAKGQPKSWQQTFYLEGGFDVACSCFLLQPFLGIEVDIFQSNTFCERGASPLNLRIHKINHTNAYSRVGVHLSAVKKCWSANFDVAWQCRLTSFENRLNVNFQSFGDTFPILGVRVPRNSLDAAANFTATLGCGWECFAEISCERWAHASAYMALGGVKYSW